MQKTVEMNKERQRLQDQSSPAVFIQVRACSWYTAYALPLNLICKRVCNVCGLFLEAVNKRKLPQRRYQIKVPNNACGICLAAVRQVGRVMTRNYVRMSLPCFIINN
jgi:hypothetical protein